MRGIASDVQKYFLEEVVELGDVCKARVNCKEVGALVSRSGGLRQFMDD